MTIELFLGEPDKKIPTPSGKLEMWAREPLLVTRVVGHASDDLAMEMDSFYRRYYYEFSEIITIHDWHDITDYDVECREIMSTLARDMRDKQKDIIIYMGEPDNFAKKLAMMIISTISKFQKVPIKSLSTNDQFVRALEKHEIFYERPSAYLRKFKVSS